MRHHQCGVALGLKFDQAQFFFIVAQMQNGVVQFTRTAQQPCFGACCHKRLHVSRRCICRSFDGDGRPRFGAVQCDFYCGIGHTVFIKRSVDGGQGDALFHIGLVRSGCHFPGPLRHRFVELRICKHFVHQPPFNGALALDALLDRTEHIGQIAAHLALVRHAGQAPGAGQHRQQRHLGQRHRRCAVVCQHDVIARQRQFISAPCAGPFDSADIVLPAVGQRCLIGVAGFVGKFAKVHFVAVRCPAQHANVRPCAKHLVFGRLQHHDLDLGMFETHPLNHISQFDVDTQIIAVQLQFVSVKEPAFFIHIHKKMRDGSVVCDLPMPVL